MWAHGFFNKTEGTWLVKIASHEQPTINPLGPIADISAQSVAHANDGSGYIRIIVKDAFFMAAVQVVERG